MTSNAKVTMRKTFLARRRALEPGTRADADAAINDNLISLPELRSTPLVAAYLSDGEEPSLTACASWIVASGRRCCFPRSSLSAEAGYVMVVARDVSGGFVAGPYGVPEPEPTAPSAPEGELRTASWLIPGVAFDQTGARLGRGKAVYDRLLRKVEGHRIGVFYDLQRAESVPVEEHDQPLSVIVTESEIIRIAKD